MSMTENLKNRRIMFVAGSGGHSAQLQILLKYFEESYDCHLVLESTDELTQKQIAHSQKHVLTLPPIRGKNEWILITFFRMIGCFILALPILWRVKPEAVVSLGPGFAIPVCFWAKLAGKKIIHIESWSRVRSKSYTGRVMYRLANLFLVQWKELQMQYPKSIFAGRLDALLGPQ